MLNKKTIIITAFSLIAFLIYFSSINSSFHFDDVNNIVDNPDININTLSLSTLKKASLTKVSGLRPVSYFSFGLNYYFSGLNTTSYHVVNVMIHIINAYLIYLIILALFGHGSLDDDAKKRLRLSAFFTALFWLVTPLNSQAVIYIVQRMTLLTTLFFLLAFYTYILGRSKNKAHLFVLSGVFFVLSLLSKQNGVVFPLVIVAYELIMVRRGEVRGLPAIQKGILAGMLAAMVILVVLYSGKINESIVKGYAIRDFTMSERLLTQPRVLLLYISQLLLPLPSRLSATHDIVTSTSLLSPVTTIFSIIIVFGLLVAAVLRVKKSPYFSFAILWFFVTMLVESTFLPLEMMFDHRMYLPCIFLIGACISYITDKFYGRNRRVLIASFCAIIIACGAMTGIRGKVWQNEITLWSDVLKKYPDDPRAHHQLAHGYFVERQYDKAFEACNAGLKIDPNHRHLLLAAGNIYDVFGLINKAQSYYKKALENSDPTIDIHTHMKALINLAAVYMDLGEFKKAEELLKSYEIYYTGEGIYFFSLGKALQKQDKHSDAVKKYLFAIEKGLNTGKVYANVVKSYISMADIKSAERFYAKYEFALSSSCNKDLILGLIAEGKKEFNKAREHFNLFQTCNKKTVP
jgi:Tfp pilus assembly protein PilF